MQLNKPSNKPKSFGSTNKSTEATVGTRRTTMAPSSTRIKASASSAVSVASAGDAAVPERHPEEPLLHRMPTTLYPEYRPLPLLIDITVILAAASSSALSTWRRMTWLQPLAVVRGLKPRPSTLELLSFITKTIVLVTLSRILLQDLLLPPTRISIDALQKNYYLPSALSKYENFQIPGKSGKDHNVGVHYLKYSGNATTPTRFEAVYAHHGFGASSLSWLPTLPRLVDRLGARVGLGHDMVGFGFTDRQKDLDLYSTDASARISNAVLRREASDSNPVALFGHSLGSLGVLQMALQLPKSTPKFIVLCAPALGLTTKFEKERTSDTVEVVKTTIFGKVKGVLQARVVYPVGGYFLRRLVGMSNSWKRGLQMAAWGNPKGVSESDVLRYQWPAIGSGWEAGLLNFARAQKRVDDKALLRSVLDLPNTTVAVILGENDKVIPSPSVRSFLEDFKDCDIPVIEMPDLGHDPFEEDAEAFVRCVESLMQSQEWTDTTTS